MSASSHDRERQIIHSRMLRPRANDPDVAFDPNVGSKRSGGLAYEIQNAPAQIRRGDPRKTALFGLWTPPHVDRIDQNFLCLNADWVDQTDRRGETFIGSESRLALLARTSENRSRSLRACPNNPLNPRQLFSFSCFDIVDRRDGRRQQTLDFHTTTAPSGLCFLQYARRVSRSSRSH